MNCELRTRGEVSCSMLTKLKEGTAPHASTQEETDDHQSLLCFRFSHHGLKDLPLNSLKYICTKKKKKNTVRKLKLPSDFPL